MYPGSFGFRCEFRFVEIILVSMDSIWIGFGFGFKCWDLDFKMRLCFGNHELTRYRISRLDYIFRWMSRNQQSRRQGSRNLKISRKRVVDIKARLTRESFNRL